MLQIQQALSCRNQTDYLEQIGGANRSLAFILDVDFSPEDVWVGWSSEAVLEAWRIRSTSNSRMCFSFCNCAKCTPWLRSRSVATGHNVLSGSDFAGKGSPSYKGGLVSKSGCSSRNWRSYSGRWGPALCGTPNSVVRPLWLLVWLLGGWLYNRTEKVTAWSVLL